MRRLGSQVNEFLEGSTRLGLGARLEVLAHRHERENRTGAFEVKVVHRRHAGHHRVAHGVLIGHEIHRVDGPGDACRGANGNQRVHRGGAVCETLETVGEVRAVLVEDGQQKQQLGEGERHRVHVVCQDFRQRPAKHVPHPDIEEWDQKHDGNDKATAHGIGRGLEPLCGIGHGGTGKGGRPGPLGSRGATTLGRRRVTSPVNRAADVILGDPRLVEVDRHGGREQVHGNLAHTVDPLDGLLDMGLAGSATHAPNVKLLVRHGTLP